MALKCFVDNVAVLVIEACLMKNLGAVFSPLLIMQMDETLTRKIAAESQENQDQRELLTRKKVVLSSGLEICQRHVSRSKLGKGAKIIARLDIHRIVTISIKLADLTQ